MIFYGRIDRSLNVIHYHSILTGMERFLDGRIEFVEDLKLLCLYKYAVYSTVYKIESIPKTVSIMR